MKKIILIFCFVLLIIKYCLFAGIILYKISDNSIIDYTFDNFDITLTNNTYVFNNKQYDNIDFSIYDIATFTDVNSNKLLYEIKTNYSTNYITYNKIFYITNINSIYTNIEYIYSNQIDLVTNIYIDTNDIIITNYNIISNNIIIGQLTNIITNLDIKTEYYIDYDKTIITNIVTNIIISNIDLTENTFINLSKKNIMQKLLSINSTKFNLINLYKSFLTNEWTVCLRNYGIIQSNFIITAYNTDSFQNIQYLLILRQLDTQPNKPTYSYFKNEFESFRINLERLGIDLGNLP